MERGVKSVFSNAILVTDRFHVVKLALDSLQHIRLRWEEMYNENNSLSALKTLKKEFDMALKACHDRPGSQAKLIEEYKVK
jgi:transposase